MFNFPFFRFPYSNYYPYYNNYIYNKKNISNEDTKNIEEKKIEINENNNDTLNNKNEEKRSSKYTSFGIINFINPFSDGINEDDPILEILGLQLYLDDLIILSLLFLLYKEDVQDEMLFLALLLLLLT